MTDRAPGTSAVCIDTLILRRIAGVTPDHAFTLPDLPPGLIILHGPNGSGKSTTARAIQELLWPDAKSEAYQELSASVTQGEEAWDLEVHGSGVNAVQGAGQVPHPAWAPSELRGRYSWSLNGLLRAEDADLAATLAAEMAGGIDFSTLGEALGWDKTPSSPQKKARDLKDATRDIRSLKSKQDDLRKQAETLGTLEKQRSEAIETRDRLPLIQAALNLQEKQSQLEEHRRTLERYSEGAKHVQPGDATRMAQALEKQEHAATGLRDLERDRERTLNSNPFPELLLEDEALERLVQTLEHTEKQWTEASRERQEASERLSDAETELERLRKRLGITDPGSVDLEGYQLPEIRNWVEAVLEVEQSAIQMRTAEKALALHPDRPPLDPVLVHELSVAVRRLREHLEGTTRKGTLPFWIAVAALGVVLGLQIQAEALPLPWAAVLPVIAATPFLWELLQKGSLAKRLATLLPGELQLAELTPTAVRELQAKLDQMDREPELRRRFEEATLAHQQNTRILEALEERVVTMGIEPRPSREWCRNFLEDLQSWRDAGVAVDQANGVLTEREKRLDTLLGTFQKAWAEVGATPVQEDPVTDAIDVRNRIAKTLSARQHLRHLDQQEQDLITRQDEAKQDITALLKRLHLAEANTAAVQELEAEHVRWQDTFRTSEGVQQRVSELRKQVTEQDALLLDLETPALHSLEAESREAAAREERLRDDITRLTQKIELAREGRDLHQAMEDRDAARAELMEERSRMAQQLAGRAILDWLQESCRTGEQPEALEEANRLLTEFTHGQLVLTLDLTPEGSVFHASRPGETPRELQDLSTGERTQVLMAVRLAFLKRNERAPLPLLVDEVLGTSDDARAEAIMQTLLQVARDGRQIFYFTAQTDEVSKWKRELERAPDVPHALIDLHALRTGNPVTPIELPPLASPLTSEVLRRPDESRTDWAARIGVPAWNGHDGIASLPLFLIMEDEEDELTRCLTHRISTWGPLENLILHDAADPLIPIELGRKLQARATAMKAYASAWRIGRPPAIDPASVMESGIISEAFSEEVLRVLKETDYDAKRFLDALEHKAIPRWRHDSTDQLRALFYEQGTLTEELPLSEEQIMSRALASMKGKEELLRLLSAEEWASVAQVF